MISELPLGVGPCSMTLTQRHKDAWPQDFDRRHNELYVELEDNKCYEKKETKMKGMEGRGRERAGGTRCGGRTIV